jgi:hypothetical protein
MREHIDSLKGRLMQVQNVTRRHGAPAGPASAAPAADARQGQQRRPR